MTNGNYSKAYKEVLEILKYIPKEDVAKIPENMIEIFKENQDDTYNFSVDTSIPFEELSLMEETELIFANLFRDYWATPYQKKIIKEKERKDRNFLEQEKREKYDSSDLFKKKKVSDKQTKEKESNLPIEVKKNFFRKLINFFINKFRKNS